MITPLAVEPAVLIYRLFQLLGAAEAWADAAVIAANHRSTWLIHDALGAEVQVEARLASQPIDIIAVLWP